MGAKRTEYQIVGRYMDGSKVTGYHLQSLEAGKSGRYTREQVIYLVGRGQVTNCEGQIYKEELLLRGVGMDLASLPVQSDRTGETSRAEGQGKIRKGATGADIMTQLNLVEAITNGRQVVGYTLRNAAGAVKRATRADVMTLARDGRLGNARVQMCNGKELLRGVGYNLNDLPQISADAVNG